MMNVDELLPSFLIKFIEKHNYLTREQEQELARVIQDPTAPVSKRNECRNKLVSANYRFALATIQQYDLSAVNADFEDLFQRAVEGLIAAADKFEPDRGKFCTFAKYWIIAKAGGLVKDNLYCVKTTSTTKQKVEMVIELANAISHAIKEEVHPQDVAELCGFRMDEISVGLEGLSYTPLDEIDLGLEYPIELIEPLAEKVKLALTPFEYDIIARRCGLGGARPQNSFEIGRFYCVSGQRIRVVSKSIAMKLEKEFGFQNGGGRSWMEKHPKPSTD